MIVHCSLGCTLLHLANLSPSQVRTGDLDEFFKHKNQAYPAHLGLLRSGTKSDLLMCLQDTTPIAESTSQTTVEVTILDDEAVVNMLRPGFAKHFRIMP